MSRLRNCAENFLGVMTQAEFEPESAGKPGVSYEAERERARIIQRTKEGRRLAMRNGVKMGPRFKLTDHQRGLATRRMAEGESTRKIARDFNVSHNTIARLR
jgi:DNA-binding NarL/FixJ family response regulator